MSDRKYWLLIDLDDTLGGVRINNEVMGTEAAYALLHNEFCDRMAHLGFDRDLASSKRYEVQCEICEQHGFADKGIFPRSMSDTYELLGGTDMSEADNLGTIGWRVFGFPYRPLPGAIKVLAELSKHYKIAVVTKGNKEEQQKKVFEMGIWPYVDQTIIIGHKSREEWEKEVIARLRLDKKTIANSWAIGNSVKSDINHPLNLGFNAIHVKNDTWAFESADLNKPRLGRELHQVERIEEVLKFIPHTESK